MLRLTPFFAQVKSISSDLDGATLENLSTMRTEILSLYSQPGGSIAVQKSQLATLTPKEILDMADSSFGQMHTLVACLEAWRFLEVTYGMWHVLGEF